MKHILSRVGLASLLACGMFMVCTSAQAQDAAGTYKAKCAMCHGANGEGGKMGTRSFGSADIQSQSDAQLAETISKGKPPKMPSYAGKLSDDQIKELAAYVKSLGKK